jgi:hypothetical protein
MHDAACMKACRVEGMQARMVECRMLLVPVERSDEGRVKDFMSGLAKRINAWEASIVFMHALFAIVGRRNGRRLRQVGWALISKEAEMQR